jgi:hypothetical protein
MEHELKANIAIIMQDVNNEIANTKIKAFVKKYLQLQNNHHLEIFNKKYCFSNLSLMQNLNFYSNLYDMNMEFFLEHHYLSDIYNDYQYEPFKSIPAELQNEIAFCLYFYLNKISVIDHNQLFKFIDGPDPKRKVIAQNYFESNSVIYIFKGRKKAIKNLSNYFNVFATLHNDNDIIHDSYDELKNYLDKA